MSKLQAQAFRPGKAYEKKIALKGRPTSGCYSQKITFVKSDSMTFQKQKSACTIRCERDRAIKYSNNISMGWCSIPVRPPFQGDSVVRVVLRSEGLGYSLFALRATANVQTPGLFPSRSDGELLPMGIALALSVSGLRSIGGAQAETIRASYAGQ